MLVVIAIWIEVAVVSRFCRRLLAVATIATVAILSFVVLPGTAHAVGTGAITVDGKVATRYDAYQLFSAIVADDADADQKVATDVTWANDAVRQAVLPVIHDAGLDSSASGAQEAAEWMDADGHITTALTAKLARAICNAGATSVALNADTAAELPCGYWLIVADDDAIAQGEAGTAPTMALVGGSAVTVKPKAATPKVSKHVLEDGTASWQKAADATAADDLYWRLSATVPAGLAAYDTYAVRFVDTMGAGLDPSKVAASMHVYVAAGADGGFDAVSTGKDGRVGTEPAKGWTDITAQCGVSVDGKTFTVRTGDLIAALGGADAFTAGILTTDGSWSTDADACVTTGADGHVELSGVDAGAYTVEEVAAPKGYTAFEAKRTVTVTAEGLDVKQVAVAKPKVTVSTESPLRVDTADAGTGSIGLSVLNTPSKEASRGFMPSTGDRTLVLVAVLAAIGVAAIVVALVIKRGGGRREK